jgi:septum formation protein
MNTTEKKNDKPLLILASKSARRRYLLKQAGINFTVIESGFDESTISLSSPENYVKILAESKAKYISDKYPESWVIGADTVVVIKGKILGKPSSRDDARTMLEGLSGQTHEVITGYCICCKAK